MGFRLQEVVPWGRSYAEYRDMFALTRTDLKKDILGCADGPANFNAEQSKKGGTVISVDPLYRFSAGEIKDQIDKVFGTILDRTRKNAGEFVWKTISSVEALGEIRRRAMNDFLDDYTHGKEAGRYRDHSLPTLPFPDQSFGMALCSHYLFLYSAHLSLDFHRQSLRELARVAKDVRVFPLLELGAVPSRHLDEVCRLLSEDGLRVHIERVPYEFQRGGNHMLCIRSS